MGGRQRTSLFITKEKVVSEKASESRGRSRGKRSR